MKWYMAKDPRTVPEALFTITALRDRVTQLEDEVKDLEYEILTIGEFED
jgi:hypothetical protein